MRESIFGKGLDPNSVEADIVSEMVDAALKGDFATALKAHRKYYPLFRNLFIESNPIPVKAAMGMTGVITPEYRLPLCEMTAPHAEILRKTLQDCGVLRV